MRAIQILTRLHSAIRRDVLHCAHSADRQSHSDTNYSDPLNIVEFPGQEDAGQNSTPDHNGAVDDLVHLREKDEKSCVRWL